VVRRLDQAEIDGLLSLAVPIHLASVDGQGFPHVTPLWFEWDGEAFWMTSLAGRPHLRRLADDPAASVSIDVEEPERDDGERPNRQVRAIGHAELLDDVDGARTRRITERYVVGPSRDAVIRRRTAAPRVAIRLVPLHLVAIASV
jgi:nitroimidazol reductase NimA-like FMN-containing flavoprotein (pyridoxamine 5'-phosphate oxidase superfamily)